MSNGMATIVGLLVVAWLLTSLVLRARDTGHRRCAYCGSVLKFMTRPGRLASHADVCRRCGNVQPWAQGQ